MEKIVKKINAYITTKQSVNFTKQGRVLAEDYYKKNESLKESKANYVKALKVLVLIWSLIAIYAYVNTQAVSLLVIFSCIGLFFNFLFSVAVSNENAEFEKIKNKVEDFFDEKKQKLEPIDLLEILKLDSETNHKKLEELKSSITEFELKDLDNSDLELNSDQILALKELSRIKKTSLKDSGVLHRNEKLLAERKEISESIKDLAEEEDLSEEQIKALKNMLENYNTNDIEIRND